ncbi:MAG TPA: class I adenylate-forming enzyme family protein [Acidimicrobiales bacterium]|nr:class I adenylate-forming enzyme family protein [Acidimicrobiales bacterium]
MLPFGDVPGIVGAVAERLARAHGIGAGDRVALAGRPSLEHALVMWATVALGAVVVTMNPAWTPPELAHALTVTRPLVVAADPAVLPRVRATVHQSGTDSDSEAAAGTHAGGMGRAGGRTDGPTSGGAEPGPVLRTFGDVVGPLDPGEPPRAPLPGIAIAEDDPFAVVFTSGTTGRPKGATLSHRNAVHFSLAAAATTAVHGLVHGVGGPPADAPAMIGSAPLFHVSGLLGQLTNAAMWGTTIVFAPPDRWDATEHLALTERHRVTSWSVVPTQLWRLVDHPDLDRFDLSSLVMVGGGGAAFPPELLRRTAERLPQVSTALRVGYGMTEVSGTATLLEPPYTDRQRASVGRPVAGTEVAVRGPDGRELPDGEVGEVWVRAASVFLGYWDDPDATAACLDVGRWYATGDVGRIDEGVLVLESRRRDLIIRGGENVYPIEIENRLVEHPGIADAAVVGVAHATLGQQVKAVVVRAPGRHGAALDAAAVRAWAAGALARYKVPQLVAFRDELPRNAAGKVLKDELAERL